MRFISTLFIAVLSLPLNAIAKKELPQLKAKQALDNIRLITTDGRFTYYQRRSGDLQLFTNYSNENLLKGEKLSQYSVSLSKSRKRIIITKDESMHTDLRVGKSVEIFLADLGKANPVKHGYGLSPRLHQSDGLLSFFDPDKKQLQLKRLSDGKIKKINLLNAVNDFFIPQVFMPTANDVIYSDLNKEGREGFLIHSLLDKKTSPVYKSAHPGSKLEACMIGNDLYIGEFSRGFQKNGSKISKLSIYNNQDFQKIEVVYQTLFADIGNMVCTDEEIFFIKTISTKEDIAAKETEVAKLSLKDNKVTVLTDMKELTQLVGMDRMVLSPYRGRYYIVKGPKNLTDDEIKKERKQ